jgi:hypothetical protein
VIDLHTKDAALFVDMIERLVLMCQVTSEEARELIAEQLDNESWRTAMVNDASDKVLPLIDTVRVFLDACKPTPKLAEVKCSCEFDYDLEKHPDGDIMCCIHCGRELPAEDVRSP